jgi:hypothetical protein
MENLSFPFGRRFSRDGEIDSQLCGPKENVINALNSIAEAVMYGDSAISFEMHLPSLITVIGHSPDEEIIGTACGCVRSAVEAEPGLCSLIIDEGPISVLANVFNSLNSVTACEHLVHVFEVISRSFSAMLSIRLNYGQALYALKNYFATIEKRLLMTLLLNISRTTIIDAFVKQLKDVADEIYNNDKQISAAALRTALNVACRAMDTGIPDSVVHIFADRLLNGDSETALLVLEVMTKMSTKGFELVKGIINENIDFRTLLSREDTSDWQRKVLVMIRNLLPSVSGLAFLDDHRQGKPEQSKDFAATIQPILADLIMEKMLVPDLTFLCFAKTLEVSEPFLRVRLVLTMVQFLDIPDFSLC